MVFGVLTNFTDGFVVIYVAILIICLLFNNKILPGAPWMISGLFALFQLVVTIWIGAEGDDSSMLVMAFVFFVAVFKMQSDIKNSRA